MYTKYVQNYFNALNYIKTQIMRHINSLLFVLFSIMFANIANKRFLELTTVKPLWVTLGHLGQGCYWC